MSSSNCCFLTYILISQEAGQVVWYSHLKKNTFESVQMRWMELEPIIQSEISQKEKHQYHILTHIYGIYKMVTMTLYARQQKRHRCKEVFWILREKARVE